MGRRKELTDPDGVNSILAAEDGAYRILVRVGQVTPLACVVRTSRKKQQVV
jgi:hypothetical protein